MAGPRLTPVERLRILELGQRRWSLRSIVAALGTNRSIATVRAVLDAAGVPRPREEHSDGARRCAEMVC
jgi:hypothetical protein